MDCYFTLCHNTYGYSLLFCKVYIRRENAGSWNSGLEKEKKLETYSAQLQKSWNSTECLKINKEKSSPKMKARGPTPCSRGWGVRPPTSWAPWWLSYVHLLLYEVFWWEKMRRNFSGRDSAATRRNLGGTNLELRQSCSAGDTSLREGESSPSSSPTLLSSGGGQSPSTSSPAPSPLKP